MHNAGEQCDASHGPFVCGEIVHLTIAYILVYLGLLHSMRDYHHILKPSSESTFPRYYLLENARVSTEEAVCVSWNRSRSASWYQVECCASIYGCFHLQTSLVLDRAELSSMQGGRSNAVRVQRESCPYAQHFLLRPFVDNGGSDNPRSVLAGVDSLSDGS